MWNFKFSDNEKKPRYLAIADALEHDILSGELAPGTRMMTHRELAIKTGVTVSTVTKAYAEMERRGLAKGTVGRGTYVLNQAHRGPAPQQTMTDQIVEMGVAMPLPHLEPDIKPIMQKVMEMHDIDSLAKSFSPLACSEHRKIGAEWLSSGGVDATPDSTLVTNGHQHSLVSIFSSLFEAGDCIAVDYLANQGFMVLAQRSCLELEGIIMDEHGMVPELLDKACQTKKIRGVYLTGNVQNPSARRIPHERCKDLCDVIARHNLILIEDASFSMGMSQNNALSASLPASSVYFASISSAIYAGLRVGFVHAPITFYSRISQAIMANIWTVAPLCVALVCEAISSGAAEKAIQRKRKELERRVALLKSAFADFDLTCSEQSIYAWLTLPGFWRSRDFEQQAEKHGVRVFSADRFIIGNHVAPNCVRLAFTGPSDIQVLKRGLNILAGLLHRKEEGSIAPIW